MAWGLEGEDIPGVVRQAPVPIFPGTRRTEENDVGHQIPINERVYVFAIQERITAHLARRNGNSPTRLIHPTVVGA